MIRNLLLTTLLFVALLPVASAQDDVKIKHIHQLMDVMGTGKLGVQAMSNMLDVFKKQYPQVDPQFWEDFKKEVTPEDLVNMVVPIYAKYFNDNDIQQLLVFYNSPVGKKLTGALPAITQESMQAGMQWGQQVGQKIQQRLKEKGYLKNS